MPSLRKLALGKASRAYWYDTPEEMMPTLVSPISTRLSGLVSAARPCRAGAAPRSRGGERHCWEHRVFRGVLFEDVDRFDGHRALPARPRSWSGRSGWWCGRAPACRTARRARTPSSGIPSPPRCPKARAAGSSRTSRSCGCPARSGELWSAGSSAVTRTSPPLTPVYAGREQRVRGDVHAHVLHADQGAGPAIDAPMPTSMATFSLGDHSL